MTVVDGPAGGPARDNGGIWWSPEEPGWSLVLYQASDDRLIGGWLSYASDGSPIWLFSQPGSWISPDVYEAPLLATSGGPYFGADSPQPAPAVRRVGTIRYNLAGDGALLNGRVIRTGRISYDVDGVLGTRTIQTSIDD